MRPRGCAWVLMAVLVGWVTGGVAFAESAVRGGPPMIVSTSPTAGTNDVSPSVVEITVTFDRDMAKGFSWTGGGTDYPPLGEGKRPFWRDERTAVLPVKLESGHYYRVGINSKSHRNFRSAAGIPALPSAIYFTTRGSSPELVGKMREAVGAASARASRPFKMDFSPDKIQMPVKKWPDVSGVVMSLGKADASKPKLESVARAFAEQAEAEKSGALGRIQEIGCQTSSVFSEVFGQSRPVPHAVVTLFSLSGPPETLEEQVVTADDEGRFEFFDVGQGLYRIVAQDTRRGTNGCAAAVLTVEHYRTREHVQIVIHPETLTAKGRVTDSRGHALTNVTVSAKQGHERFAPSEGDFTRAYHETTAVTDSEGRYELRGLVPAGLWEARGLEGGGYGGAYAWYTVAISEPGYASCKAYVPIVSEETRQAARMFSGLLKRLASPHEKADWRKAEPVVQPLCRGNTLVGVDFVLHKPVCVDGAVIDKDSVPQPGCTVCLERTNSVEWCSYEPFDETPSSETCDAEGHFRFGGVPPGAYRVRVYEANRLVNGKSPSALTVREGEPVSGFRIVYDAPPFGKIEGVVTDGASGKPVMGVTLFYFNREMGSTQCVPLLCLCGKGGYHTAECERWMGRVLQTNDTRVSAFVADKVSPGKAELAVKAPEYAEEHVSFDVAPGGISKREIKLWRAGTARIRPVVKDGARVSHYDMAGKPLLVRYVAVPLQERRCVTGGRPSKQTGYDEFAGLKPGRYTFRGEIDYMPGAVSRYETVPVEIVSDRTSDVALEFDGACEIKLELVFSPGTAVWMSLETADTPSGQELERNLGLRARAYFREPGSYLVPDLKPGSYRLSLFRMKVPSDKGQKEKPRPDQVKVLTLDAGHAKQTLGFHF